MSDLQALLGGIQQAESGGQDYAADGTPLTSSAGARYAMQVEPATAADPGYGVTPAADDSPQEYDRVGRDLFNAFLNKYQSPELAAAAYNAGPGTVDKAITKAGTNDPNAVLSSLPAETQAYVPKVLSAAQPVQVADAGNVQTDDGGDLYQHFGVAPTQDTNHPANDDQDLYAHFGVRAPSAPDLFQNIATDVLKRGAQANAVDQFGGQQTPVETIMQKAGYGGRAIGDTIGDIGKSGYNEIADNIPDGVKNAPLTRSLLNAIGVAGSTVGKYAGLASIAAGNLIDTSLGNQVPAQESISGAYGREAAKYPRLARDISAPFGIAQGVPALGLAEGAADLAGNIPGVVGDAVSGTITPAVSASKLPIAQMAAKHGIPLGLDDLTDSPLYKSIISGGADVPLSGAKKFASQQQMAIINAITREAGSQADAITPEYMAERATTLGDKFNSFTDGKSFSADGLQDELKGISTASENGDYGPEGQAFLQKYIDRVNGVPSEDEDGNRIIKGGILNPDGTIDGNKLDNLRQSFATTARKRQDGIGDLASDFENQLVNLISSGDPATAADISNTKYQYKNYKLLQPLAIKDQVNGTINPADLMGAVKKSYGENALATGNAGNMGEIARVAQTIKQGTSSLPKKIGIIGGLSANAAEIPLTMAVNPIAGSLQAAGTGAGLALNRGLQARNFKPEVVAAAIKKAMEKQ